MMIVHPVLKPHMSLDKERGEVMFSFPSKVSFLDTVSSLTPDHDSVSTRNQNIGYNSHRDLHSSIRDVMFGWKTAEDFFKRSQSSKFYDTYDTALTLAESLSVSGYRPCVPTYLSGDPENMFSIRETESKVKIIDIVVSLGFNANIEEISRLNFGIALTEIIDNLENSGIRVGLRFDTASDYRSGYILGEGYKLFRISVEIKKPSEIFNLSDCLSFCAVSDIQRRMMFLLQENCKIFEATNGDLMGRGYGHSIGASLFPSEKDSALLIKQITSDIEWGKIESSRLTLNTQLEEFLTKSDRYRIAV